MTLSDLDRSILLLVAADHPYKNIGFRLDVPMRRVRQRMAWLHRKYGTHSPVGLVVKLHRLGVLSMDDIDELSATESAWVQRARANE
jgi:hypothetical protein